MTLPHASFKVCAATRKPSIIIKLKHRNILLAYFYTFNYITRRKNFTRGYVAKET